MADGTLDSELFYLLDRWPGVPWPSQGNPVCADGAIAARSDHNVASSDTPLGSKIQVYNKSSVAGADGLSVFVYLQGEYAATPTVAVKHVVVPDANTALYVVTNDPDANLSMAAVPIAIAIGAMTDAHYGWYWCGGVCPEGFVSTFAGDFPTVNDVALGSGLIVGDLADQDAIGFHIQDAAGDIAIGITLSTDS